MVLRLHFLTSVMWWWSLQLSVMIVVRFISSSCNS